ncbi:MAG: hypothetical protein SF162_03400 [bacterium]|nr:hypothetical protein [bacterium]
MTAMNTSRSDYGSRPAARTSTVVENETIIVDRQGISWGAVIAGVVVTLVVMAGLNMLGLAIGATTINPLTERDPIEPALGTAALFWFLGTGLLALFAGGWVASHLAHTFDQTNGMLHGLVSWGVATILAFLLVSTSIGNLINGLTGAVGQSISLLTQGAVQAVPAVADSLNLEGLTREAITADARSLSGQPNQAAPGAAGTEGAEQPTAAENTFSSLQELEFNTVLFNFLSGDQSNAELRQNAVDLLASRTGISPEEANAQLDQWAQSFNTVREDAEQTAREVGEQLTNTLATVAGGVFLAMLLGAVAGSIGGVVGTRNLPDSFQTRRTADAGD